MHDYLFVRLTATHDLMQTPVDWLLSDNNGKIIEFTGKPELLRDLQSRDLEFRKIVLIIPDGLVSYNIAEIPIKDKAKRHQAVKFILEDKIISDIDNTTFIVGPEIETHQYLVAAVDTDKLNNILGEFKDIFQLFPTMVVTDALCLYKTQNDNYSLYIDYNNNLALIVSKTIAITYLKNLNLVFGQIVKNSDSRLNVDIYKQGIDNLNKYVEVDKVSITSEQQITDWLPFLVSNWFVQKPQSRMNLASTVLKQSKLDLNFSPLWRYTAVLWIVLFIGLVGYKYIDSKVYSERRVELDSIIKTTLNNNNISTNNIIDLQKAEQLIDRESNKLAEEVQKERLNDEFKILLAAFSTTFNPAFKLNYIIFKNHKLEINFTVNKNNSSFLEETKSSLAEQKITLTESIKEQDNIYNATWIMSV